MINGERNSSPDMSAVMQKWADYDMRRGANYCGYPKNSGNDNDPDGPDNDVGAGAVFCSDIRVKDEIQQCFMELNSGFQNMDPMSCELCGDMFIMPVPYHMVKNHPGCGQSSSGYGYTNTGIYKSEWSDSNGACGESTAVCYMLCEQCRCNYMQKRRGRSAAPGSDRYRKTAAAAVRRIPAAADDATNRRKSHGQSSKSSLSKKKK